MRSAILGEKLLDLANLILVGSFVSDRFINQSSDNLIIALSSGLAFVLYLWGIHLSGKEPL